MAEINNSVVEKLNESVKVRLAPSPIHGIGVFAIRDIKKGEKVWCVRGEKPDMYTNVGLGDVVKEVRDLILQRWPQAKYGGLFMSPNDDARMLSFMNHSDTPSYDPETDTALRDIKKGEEVTEDYEESKWIIEIE